MLEKKFYITKPVLPSILKYALLLNKAWKTRVLSNQGVLARDLVLALQDFLSVQDLSLVSNGTVALEISLQALNLKPGAEVVTTPYSFVATSNAIIRCGYKPVFVDIEEDGFNVSSKCIEDAITERTGAIMVVHTYGVPADFEAIKKVSGRYGLPVIYDAAHAFGVEVNNVSALSLGDISTCSFHATKVFNTAEGGCIVVNNKAFGDVTSLVNFGFCEENDISSFGTNGKMSELSAALGLLNLQKHRLAIKNRKKIFERYIRLLNPHVVVSSTYQAHLSDNIKWNYSYMPVTFSEVGGQSVRDELRDFLVSRGIMARKYFFPLIYETTAYRNRPESWRISEDCRNGRRAARETLCLPIYPCLQLKDVDMICDVVNSFLKR